ncbi:MAG: hypothetical protein HYV75_07010 [Opitutae bacterium]|nr:hypothetical protein [Opitutae bacterium]
MPDMPDPPPKSYGFKERAFKRDNALTSAQPPVPTAKQLAMMAGPVVRSGPVAGPKPGDPNDVYAVLHQNRAVERRFGKDEVEIREIKSRRVREFWLLLVGGNLAIIGGVFLSGINVITVIFGLAGLIIFSLGVTWVMWQVMDRY